jgi:RNA polymerase sigma factor for flagellar operon FliA
MVARPTQLAARTRDHGLRRTRLVATSASNDSSFGLRLQFGLGRSRSARRKGYLATAQRCCRTSGADPIDHHARPAVWCPIDLPSLPARRPTTSRWSLIMAKSAAALRPSPRVSVLAKPSKTADRLAPRVTAPAAATAPTALTEAELEVVWKTFKRTRDENLRNTLIEHHMPLVRSIAERVLQTLPKSIDVDDLSSAGTFGLMDAINGFDLSRGIKFKTYCTTRIRGSILDELRSQDWVPRLVRLKAHRLDRAIRQLEGELGRSPNQMEIAQLLGISLDELQAHEAEANAKTIFSLSEKWDDGDEDKEMEKVEILADRKSVDPVDTIQQSDALEMITGSLTKKERLIILMYYYEGLTMREIGEIMELTESRVCQIHSNVMARLKAQLDRAQGTPA